MEPQFEDYPPPFVQHRDYLGQGQDDDEGLEMAARLVDSVLSAPEEEVVAVVVTQFEDAEAEMDQQLESVVRQGCWQTPEWNDRPVIACMCVYVII